MAVEQKPYNSYTDEELRRLYESGVLSPPESIYTSVPGRDQTRPGPVAPATPVGARGAGADVYRNLTGQANPFAAPPPSEGFRDMGGSNRRPPSGYNEDTSYLYQSGNPSRGPGVGGMSPYEEFLQSYYGDLAGSYDAQIDAIGGLNPLFKQQAAEAQGNIGNFFGYAGNVAREGIPVTQETFANAEGNVNRIYDQLGERLQSMPQNLTNVARQAAGGDVGSSVAGRVAAATAPFAAASETARANANANLTQSSAAGQNYLNQLASSTGAESAMHQSSVESALNQQLQMIAYKQAEIEGAKQRALMDVSADIAGASSERMANAALAQSLGLSAPEGVDPLDYLRAQGMQQNLMQGDIQSQQAALNLTRDMNPDWQVDQVTQDMTGGTQQTMDLVRRIAEGSFQEGDDPRNLGIHMLRVLDDMSQQFAGENYTGAGTPLEDALGGNEIPVSVGVPAARKQIEDAIRALYGG